MLLRNSRLLILLRSVGGIFVSTRKTARLSFTTQSVRISFIGFYIWIVADPRDQSWPSTTTKLFLEHHRKAFHVAARTYRSNLSPKSQLYLAAPSRPRRAETSSVPLALPAHSSLQYLSDICRFSFSMQLKGGNIVTEIPCRLQTKPFVFTHSGRFDPTAGTRWRIMTRLLQRHWKISQSFCQTQKDLQFSVFHSLFWDISGVKTQHERLEIQGPESMRGPCVKSEKSSRMALNSSVVLFHSITLFYLLQLELQTNL